MILGLAKIRGWSDEEVQRLSNLYTSEKLFEEILTEFPDRTSNAIRLKASRLGLRRPTISTSMIQPDRVLKCTIKDGSFGVLFKCNECGSWMQITEIENYISNTVSCHDCGSLFQILSS